jgi:hypothetical protein
MKSVLLPNDFSDKTLITVSRLSVELSCLIPSSAGSISPANDMHRYGLIIKVFITPSIGCPVYFSGNWSSG